jgi:hypothetical protein
MGKNYNLARDSKMHQRGLDTGLSKQQKSTFDNSQTRITGHAIGSDPVKTRGPKASTKRWVAKEREEKEIAVQPKGKANPPGKGVRSTNALLDVKRMENGIKWQKTHRIVSQRINVKSKHAREDVSYALSTAASVLARRLDEDNHLLFEFLTRYLYRGFCFINFHEEVEDFDGFLIWYAEQFVRDFYPIREGKSKATRSSLITFMRTFDSTEFWKGVGRKYGWFLIPGGMKYILGKPKLIHHISNEDLKLKSHAFLNKLYRKFVSVNKKTLQGAGKGNSMISSKVKNAGSGGGRNKSGKPPQPPLNCQVKISKVEKEPGQPINADDIVTNVVGKFTCPSRLMWDAQYTRQEARAIIDSVRNNPIVDWVQGLRLECRARKYDHFGSPFCGVSAIDLASRRVPDPYKYCKLVGTVKVGGVDTLEADPIATIGDSDYLSKYASSCGVNLCIITEGDRLFPAGVFSTFDHGFSKWVFLLYKDHHYTLLVRDHSDINHMVFDDNIVVEGRGFFADYVQSINFGKILLMEDNSDKRNYVNMRESIKHQSIMQHVEVTHYHVFHLRTWFIMALIGQFSTLYCFGVPRYNGLTIDFCFPFVLGYFFPLLIRFLVWYYYSGVDDKCIINATKLHKAWPSIQSCAARGRDLDVVMLELGSGRELNDKHMGDPIIYDTCRIAKLLASVCPKLKRTGSTVGLVAVNAPNSTAIIPDMKLIMDNQAAAQALLGAGRLPNHVKKVKRKGLGVGEKLNKPVAVAPIGTVLCEGTPLGPGLFSLTDSVGVCASFVGRAMSKEWGIVNPIIQQFVGDSIEFLQQFVNDTNFDGLVEEHPCDAFVRLYSGKKPASWIDRFVSSYRRFEAGEMSAKEEKKFMKNSIFVKFESNVKVVNGKAKVRPRGIFTMSDKNKVDFVQILDLIERWYDSSFRQFQVKHMSSDIQSCLIAFMQDRNHVVTDYSAFESSINSSIRAIETWLMRELANKAGFYTLARKLDESGVEFGRSLHTDNFEFHIDSRCSGDFWTSFANGLVSVCLMKFCHNHNFNSELFVMLAEGDDGIVSDKTPNVDLLKKMGFKFSTAVSGSRPGDTDFLRCRWMEGKRYMSIGRSLKVLWVKKAAGLKRSKQLYLLRAMGLSLWHCSPGHPVLTALVRRIGRATSGCSNFKGSEHYLSDMRERYTGLVSDHFKDMEVDEDMREAISEGTTGFPPISIPAQFYLERELEFGEDMDIGGLLSNYDDVEANLLASKPETTDWSTTDMEVVYDEVCDDCLEVDDHDPYHAGGVLRADVCED